MQGLDIQRKANVRRIDIDHGGNHARNRHIRKNPLHVSEVDDNLKELSPHGSFELPVETYMANCEIFHALYDHWHSEMEIMYIEKGSGFARLNRESIRLKKGDILIVNCGVLHSMRTDLKKPLYYKSVVFSLGFLAGQPGDICQECVVSPLIENKAEFCHHIEEGDSGYEKLREIFLEIHDCHTEKKPYFYVKLKMLFFDFFYEMLTKHYIIPVSTEQNKSLAAVKKVLDHISLHYQENLTVSELSGLSNYSEYYFMKLFRQYTGKTLVEYINDFRMEKAKYLLTHSDAPVTEIAMQVGFNSTSYFIKKFQQSNKVSPHKYRKRMRQI